jgi:hypothetical protein
MCSPGALPGTTGAHTEVISGDWQQKVHGSATVNIDSKWNTTVDGDVIYHFNQNCTKKVNVNDTLKVLGNSTAVVHGSEHMTTLGPTLETRVGEHTQVHQAQEHNQDQVQFQTHGSDFSAYAFRFEADGVLFNPIGGHVDLVGRRVTAGLQIFESCLNKTEVDELDEKITGLRTDVDGASSKIGLMQDDIKALTNQLHPIKTRASGLAVVEVPILLTPTVPDALLAEFALAASI